MGAGKGGNTKKLARGKKRRMHVREFQSRLKSQLDARIERLHFKQLGVEPLDIDVDVPPPNAPQPAADATTPSPAARLDTGLRGHHTGKVKRSDKISRVQKSSSARNAPGSKPVRIRITGSKKVLS
eukprot:Hpha_TRINITY_DN14265_c0_g1::TRINITY_DN14265_c0_g1_i1::g.22736::m.22736